ncbi:MAG: anti-sigma factor [Acidobacteriaceae bacterium]|nr:anti-sigma factor [Acidobacteriaceae bacterium]
MSCHQTRQWLDAYFDGELDLVRTLEFEEHLKDCGECRDARDGYDTLRQSLQTPGVYHKAPEALQQKIRTHLRHATAVHQMPSTFAASPAWRLLAAAASIAIVVIVTALSVEWARSHSSKEILAQQVVSSHIRSLLADHLTDVPSSDQHTVKPWFNGKLDFAPDVKDLAGEGFPLAGGRLDYLDHHRVAALVYKRRQHTINLFVWPTSGSDSRPETVALDGYNIVHWNRSGMTYWAVSDLNARELRIFADDLHP